ncbi:MAG: zf-HC2 domain-containing protein [bacterium]
MLACKKASRLICDALDRDLTRRERIALRFHLCICNMCRRFRKQARFLQEIGVELEEAVEKGVLQDRLSPEARERIKEALRQGES